MHLRHPVPLHRARVQMYVIEEGGENGGHFPQKSPMISGSFAKRGGEGIMCAHCD